MKNPLFRRSQIAEPAPVEVYSARPQGLRAQEVEITAKFGTPMRHHGLAPAMGKLQLAIQNSDMVGDVEQARVAFGPEAQMPDWVGLELAVALSIVGLWSVLPAKAAQFSVIGRLDEIGQVHSVPGALLCAIEAQKRGRRFLIVPEDNADEAAMVTGLQILPARTLKQAFDYLSCAFPLHVDLQRPSVEEIPLSQNHDAVHRGLQIAAAGSHNVLLIGGPGFPYDEEARKLRDLLPPLADEEILECSLAYSAKGLLSKAHPVVTQIPVRLSHPSWSSTKLLGSDEDGTPGELSLAHNGIFLMRDLPLWNRSLQNEIARAVELRVVSHAGIEFPADFLLAGATPPCPCGYFGDLKRECHCTISAIEVFREKISSALLGKFDLHVQVPGLIRDHVPFGTALNEVQTPRAIQAQRFNGYVRETTNGAISPANLQRFCAVSKDTEEALRQILREQNFNARAYDPIRKIARTIADLDGSETIEPAHIEEAAEFRSFDRRLR